MLYELGTGARNRGLYRAAAQLHKHATAHGHTGAAAALVDLLHAVHPTDQRPPPTPLSTNPSDVAYLLDRLRAAGAHDQVTALGERAA